MADNITLNSGTGGASLATDDVGGVQHQRVKIQYGTDGAATDVSDTNPLPIDDAGGSITVDGTITADAGTGTFTVGGVAAENAAVSGNPVLAGGRYDLTPRTLGDGDVGALALDADGALQVSDGGNSLTVDGTITANLSATDNAVLDNIDTNTTGLNNCVSGTELQVDVVAALPAGTNAIGKLAANSGVDIGDVDVTSVVPGTGATALGKAQDTAAGATDTGVAMLVKRDDEQAAVTPIDGDYVIPTCDKFGKLKVTLAPDATSEPKRAIIDAASIGDNTLVAAAGAGIKIRVTSCFLVAAGTVTARFESGAAGTALTGQMTLVANSGFTLPYNPDGWFETADNTLLNLELSAAVSVDGCLTYVEV